MSDEMMNTKEVAKYLGIHEKQVYALIKSKRIPSTRVTGKWVFPKKLIDEWIDANAHFFADEHYMEYVAHKGNVLLKKILDVKGIPYDRNGNKGNLAGASVKPGEASRIEVSA